MPAAPAVLSTARLTLRQWRPDDRAPFAALNADPVVMRHFTATLDPDESDRVVDRLEAEIAQRGWGLWAVEIAATRTFIGFIGLQVPKAPLPFAPCVEVGWRLARPHWRHGYATEGAHAALAFGFATLGLAEIVSFTSLPNVRSQAVMARLGMHRDAATFGHPGVALGHPLREHVLYRLSREQWRAMRTAAGAAAGRDPAPA